MRRIVPFLLLVLSLQSKAQNFPVTSITISLPASPDAMLSKWSPGTLTVSASARMVNGKIDGRVQESKLLVTIKKGTAKICGIYNSNSAPPSHFNTGTKVWTGNNVLSLIGSECTLPPGDYELSVQFFGAGPAGIMPLSEEKSKAFSIRGNDQQTYQAPQAISPANGTMLDEQDFKKPISFRWTPVIPRPLEPVTYRLKVWQLMEGQNVAQAIIQPPLLGNDVGNLTQANVIVRLQTPLPNQTLVWNVQALNRDGKPIGSNNGTSDAFKININVMNDMPSILTLLEPANKTVLRENETSIFKWTHTRQYPGPPSVYKIKIVEIFQDQSPQQAFQNNKTHFEKDSLRELSFSNPAVVSSFLKGKRYAWGITANRNPPYGEVKVTESEINEFVVSTMGIKPVLSLISPASGTALSASEKPKFTWISKSIENNYSSGSNQLFKIKIVEIKGDQSPEEALRINKSHFEKAGLKESVFEYSLNGPEFINGRNYAWNVTGVYDGERVPLNNSSPSVSEPFTFKIKDEKIVPPVCDCGRWNALSLRSREGVKKYECGSDITLKCKVPIQFSVGYQCNTKDEQCQAKTTWEIKKGNVVIKAGTGINNISDDFNPTENGTYILTLNASCNNIKCKPCTYTIVVRDCVETHEPCSNLSLCNAGFEEFVTANPQFNGLFEFINEANVRCWKTTAKNHKIEMRKTGTIPAYAGNYFVELNSDQVSTLYQTFNVTGNIIIAASFAHRGRYSGFDKMEVLIADPSGVPIHSFGIFSADSTRWVYNTTQPFYISTPGAYTLRFKSISSNNGSGPDDGGNYLDSISLSCTSVQPPPACTCGTWDPLVVKDAEGSKRYDGRSRINWKCKQPFNFSGSFQCKTGDDNCKAKVKWTITKDGNPFTSGTGATGSFTPTANGTYTITLNAICGEIKCKPATYTMLVEGCTPDNSCKNNLIRNGGFDQANVAGTMPSPGAILNWDKGYGSPIVNNDTAEGFIEKGYIKLSGNVNDGHALTQLLTPGNKIVQGKKYIISVAVRLMAKENTSDYVRIRVIAFNGNISSANGVHPAPSNHVAIIGRSGKIKDCGDWSVVELPVWTAGKDYSNIAINAFTNDNQNATVWIDNITACETNQNVCDEVQTDDKGNPVIPAGYGNLPGGFNCVSEAENDDYFNGSLQDLYPGYDGTSSIYEQSKNDCFSIGGTLPDEATKYNCDDSLKAAGIDMTCDELQALLKSDFDPKDSTRSFLPIPLLTNTNCDLPASAKMAGMAFKGRDIIYIHGLQLNHLIDRANGVTGTTGKWPNNQNEYYYGYYKQVAYNNMMPHISHFLRNKGNQNRFIVVVYDCSENAEVAVHAVLTQIREAMQNGTGVIADSTDPRGRNCFGRDYVMISHSTGALVADVALSIANKTKQPGALQTKYGNLGLISDRCKGRVSIQGAYSGSNLAKIACLGQSIPASLLTLAINKLTHTPINIQGLINNQNVIANSILVDLTPEITRARWASYINEISVPVFSIAGGHPSAILGALKYIIHPGFDDGVLTMDCANGNNNPLSMGPSSFSASAPKVFDMGLPLIRATKYYHDQKIGNGVFAAASTAYLSPSGMVQPVISINVNPQQHFKNHFSFIQSSKEHWFNSTELGSGNTPCDYAPTIMGTYVNNEEQLVVSNSSLFTPGLIDPSIISQVGETIKGRYILYPTIKIVWRHGIPKPSVYWKEFYIWKRTYHKLYDNCMYDVEYGYNYLFKQ
jgi:hypothetical protein